MKKLLVCAALLSACTSSDDLCSDPARVADLPSALDESSGIAASRTHPGVFWAHNDSEGTPLLYAIDSAARLLAEIGLPDAPPQSDWEDIATGPCPHGDCVYIGDIGDNLHDRTDPAILRVAEPDLGANSALAVERFPFRYPDAPEDAEAIFVTADTTVFIVTKGRRSAVTVFRMPALRERAEDIEPNLDYELSQLAARTGRHISFSREAREQFLAFAIERDRAGKGRYRSLDQLDE